MGGFSAESFAATLALIGGVIAVAALLSGFIDRTGLPQVAVFLGLGAALGPAGLRLLDVSLESPVLRAVATLSLVLVLFTDAVNLDINEARRHGRLALLVLGPGTLLTAALIALAGWGLLGLAPPAALILGAALASTDPVLLRGLLRRRDVPAAARQALRLESGLNDAVLLPVVLVAMPFLGGAPPGSADLSRLAIDLFLLGPGAGVAVGLMAVATLDLVRRRIGIRRDYEAIYSLGVALTAYAAAEAVHGSGFLAAFAAGLTISALDVELCDCFLEYGESTAEMALLLTFVLFGSSLIWDGFTVFGPATAAFAVLVVLARPPAFLLALARTPLDRPSRFLIAWYGPRGLSSLLLVLLPVFAGLPGSARLFAICSLVVLLSVVVHGGSPMLLGPRSPLRPAVPTAAGRPPTAGVAAEAAAGTAHGPEEATVPIPESPPAGDGLHSADQPAEALPSLPPHREGSGRGRSEPLRISVEELHALWRSETPVVVLDVRTERSYNADDLRARGAVRLPPDHVAERARELNLPREAWLVAYCA